MGRTLLATTGPQPTSRAAPHGRPWRRRVAFPTAPPSTGLSSLSSGFMEVHSDLLGFEKDLVELIANGNSLMMYYCSACKIQHQRVNWQNPIIHVWFCLKCVMIMFAKYSSRKRLVYSSMQISGNRGFSMIFHPCLLVYPWERKLEVVATGKDHVRWLSLAHCRKR